MLKLLGTYIGAITNESGVAKIVAPAGSYSLSVRHFGCPPVTQPLTIPDGGTAAATVVVSCPSADVVNDPEWPAESRIWLMDVATNSSGTATCMNDLLLHGTGLRVISGNATATNSLGASCPLASLVLATDRAPFFTNAAADFNWSAMLGDVFEPPMPDVKLKLPIRIIISDPELLMNDPFDLDKTELIADIEESELPLANLALHDSYSGITLVDEGGGPPQITINDGVEAILKKGCGNAAAIRANTAIYSADRINVYYIDKVQNEEGVSAGAGWEKAGYTCNTSDAPNIIFIDHNGHTASTLAHEIGHALGLITPAWGHSDRYLNVYFDGAGRPLNIMSDASSLYDDGEYLPADPQYFSVGQVSRMHLGNTSWLNMSSASDGLTPRARQSVPGASTIVACGCPESVATGDCAAASTDIDRSAIGAPQGADPDLYFACTVVPTAPTSITICKNDDVPTEARAWQGPHEANGASTMWVAMDPTLVKAQSTGIPAGHHLTAKLTGLAVGTTTVRAYAGGVFGTFTVTVDPPC
jgi:hypothetical protein